jgi:hypothetical protein
MKHVKVNNFQSFAISLELWQGESPITPFAILVMDFYKVSG